MSEGTINPVPSSSAHYRYLALDADGGWILTTPAPPADYRLLQTWPRGEGRRLDLEVRDDDGWRISVVAYGPTDIIVGSDMDALLAALGYFLPLPRHSLAEVFV